MTYDLQHNRHADIFIEAKEGSWRRSLNYFLQIPRIFRIFSRGSSTMNIFNSAIVIQVKIPYSVDQWRNQISILEVEELMISAVTNLEGKIS